MHFIISKTFPKRQNIPTVNKTLKGITRTKKVPGEEKNAQMDKVGQDNAKTHEKTHTRKQKVLKSRVKTKGNAAARVETRLITYGVTVRTAH
jgi:hypothetical protein